MNSATAHTERCGRAPESGRLLTADVTANAALACPGATNATTAYSVLEAMRFGAARVLDMHMDDLADPRDRPRGARRTWMRCCGIRCPAAPGLLDQLCERSARDRAGGPRGRRELPRGVRLVLHRLPSDLPQRLLPQGSWSVLLRRRPNRGVGAVVCRSITTFHRCNRPLAPSVNAVPVNDAEVKLRHLLLAAGFGEGAAWRADTARSFTGYGTEPRIAGNDDAGCDLPH